MYEVYFHNFKKRVALTEEEEALIKSYLSVKKIRKRQFLLQEDDVCKTIAFVEHGMLRSFSVDDAGSEHILQFAAEGWFISDMLSFLTEEPATFNIEAVENSELVLISKSAHEELLKLSPKYETFIRELITNAYIALQKRINANNSQSIEERYEDFIHNYPDITKRVPQHMIASYMGTTPETISRIRKRLTTRK
ncbi:Crp/Fnr family transcriptional regulator [Neptunitalea lumnitzerae]|uniref:Cyclic nucleotide-binding protein n=1 Tax=Neptunitalea lumnitzerae TaxID=2965509 RepID=A0ABQ5MFZ7_9FLAO|nr:Crp/Fnr family transcriptional regulator [Neptunitalea sp. Y10]GLB48330.1 cyclic nucleotide-binding protein [Neptunitalea sp. Y10]